MTQLTTAWNPHHHDKKVNVTNNSNVAVGHFNNSSINMSNGGVGNVQANSKDSYYGYHR